MSLGICTMPGCLSQAFWVHGTPMEDASGGQIFPWELCNCCHESALAADRALADAGIAFPSDESWCFEAARSRNQRLIKLEGLKKK